MTGRLLIAYSNASNYVATTAEYLAAFGRYSTWDVRYIHVTHGAVPDVDLDDFDVVLQSYCARLPLEGYVAEGWIEKLRAFRGIKALAVQDEYDHTHRLHAAIRDIGFDIVLTCVPADRIESIYHASQFPGTTFVPVLTGYVPEGLPIGKAIPLRDRVVTIGYRGRDISPRYGLLAYDKLDIGRRMRDVCWARGIRADIAWGEGDRLYGDAWYSWIGRCRVNLATESGSNAFDWDGEIEAEYRRRNLIESPVDWYSFLEWVAPYEVGHEMGQISPRIFEAAAMRTGLVCYPGNYSGIIKPWVHYIPLQRDFSNIDDVIRCIEDDGALSAMIERTWCDLIGSGNYSYPRFVSAIDTLWESRPDRIKWGRPLSRYAAPPPLVDCAALRSMVERPTRQPNPPLLFAFKKIAEENRRLVDNIGYQAGLAKAFSERLRHEGAEHAAALAEVRSALVMAQAKANGHAPV